MPFDAARWSPPVDLAQRFASGSAPDLAVSQTRQAIISDLTNAGIAIDRAEAAANAAITRYAEALAHGGSPDDALAAARQELITVSSRSGDPGTCDPVRELTEALAAGDGSAEAKLHDLLGLWVDGPGAKAIASEALRTALAAGGDLSTSLKQAVASAETAQAVQVAGAVPVAHADGLAALLSTGGADAAQALKTLTAGMTPEQAAAFSSALASALHAGTSAGAALNSASNAASAAGQIADHQSVPVSAADRLAAALASGQEVAGALHDAGVTGNDAASQAAADSLSRGLAAGGSAQQALADAGAAAQASQQIAEAASSGLPANALAQALASGIGAASAVADAGAGAGNASAFAAALSDALAAGASVDAARGAAESHASAAEAQSQAASAPGGSDLASALATGTNSAAAIAAAGGSDHPEQAQAFAAALSDALATGSDPAAAASLASAAAAAAGAQQAAADSPPPPGSALAAALASGSNVGAVLDTLGGASAQHAAETALASGADPAAAVVAAAAAQPPPTATEPPPAAPPPTALPPTAPPAAAPPSEPAAPAQVATLPPEAAVETTPPPAAPPTSPPPVPLATLLDPAGPFGALVNPTAPAPEPAPPPTAPTLPDPPAATLPSANDPAAPGPTAPEPGGETLPLYLVNTLAAASAVIGAVDDAGTALEAGGRLNAIAGKGATGNVLANDIGTALTVTTVGGSIPGAYGIFSILADGSFRYVVDNANPTVDALPAGATLIDKLNYTLSDGIHTDLGELAITIAGANDAPIATDDTGAALERGGIGNALAGSDARGTVLTNDTDVDTGTVLTVTAIRLGGSEGAGSVGTVGNGLVGSSGTLTLNADGSYVYVVDNANPTVQALAAGETMTESFNYTVSDGSLTDIGVLAITITGANDAPTIVIETTTVSGGFSETAGQSGASDGPHAASGTIAFADVDASDLHLASSTAISAFWTNLSHVTVSQAVPGTFSLDPVNDPAKTVGWTYSAAGSDIDFLAAGETLVVNYRVTLDDRHGGTISQPVTITITGANDLPVITSQAQSGTVSEGDDGAARTATGRVTFTDIDTSDTPALSVSSAATYGSSTVDADGIWQYSATDAGAVDRLAAGAQLADHFTVRVDDHHGGIAQQVVNITITGTNDAPTVTNNSSYTMAGPVRVADILGSSVGWTDVDTGATKGLAVTNFTGSGWQYSTNYGTPTPTWNNFGGATTDNNALLLSAGTWIRYFPSEVGDKTLTFRAWDTTDNALASTDGNANYHSTALNGAQNAYSANTAQLIAPGKPNINEDFTNEPAISNKWLIAGSTLATPTPDEGVILTTDSGDQVGYLIYDTPFLTGNGIDVTISYEMPKMPGVGADGISVFLLDGGFPVSASNSGASGGGLGYKDYAHGVLGIGLDQFGNFTNIGAGSIGLRGTSNQAADLADVLIGSELSGTSNTLHVVITPLAANYGVAVSLNGTLRINYTSGISLPDTLTVGFSAATGGSFDLHAIQSVSIRSINDPPLAPITEDTVAPPGETIASLYNGIDTSGGVRVIGNQSTADQGLWQYSTDHGQSWTSIGDDHSLNTPLQLSAADQIRFAPAADWNGAPGGLMTEVASVDDLELITTRVTPVNDAPVLSGTGSIESIAVRDVDSPTLASATVTIAAASFHAGDLLDAATTANIAKSYDRDTGTLTLTGTDTITHYQEMLRSVTVSAAAADPDPAAPESARTLLFHVDDGQAANHDSNVIAATAPTTPSGTNGSDYQQMVQGSGTDPAPKAGAETPADPTPDHGPAIAADNASHDPSPPPDHPDPMHLS